MRSSYLAYVVAFAGAVEFAAADAPADLTDWLFLRTVNHERAIVMAQTESVNVQNGEWRAELSINKVYYGDAAFMGAVFEVRGNVSGDGNLVVYPPLKDGEQAIWNVRKVGEQVVPEWRSTGLLVFPGRESGDGSFGPLGIWVGFLGKAGSAQGEARVRILKDAASRAEGPVAFWGVMALGRLPNPDADWFHDVFRDKKFSVEARLAADAMLGQIEGASRQNENERLATLADLVRLASTPELGFLVLEHVKTNTLESQYARLLAEAVLDARVNERVRQEGCRKLGELTRGGENAPFAFEKLSEVITSAGPNAVRLAAAHAIRNFLRPTEEQRARILAISSAEKDEDMRQILASVLAKTDERN